VKVNINMTLDATDADRRAVNYHVGRPGMATREDVKRYLRAYLRTALEDLTDPRDDDGSLK
jgi:hypothetical protein